jgi:hypothetical protein
MAPKSKKPKAKAKLDFSKIELDIKKYEENPKPIVDIKRLFSKKKQLESKVKQEKRPEPKKEDKSENKLEKEEKVEEDQKEDTEFLSSNLEPTRNSSKPIIQERERERPVRNMENFLEQVPSEKKEEKKDEKYSTQRTAADYEHGGARYERRDEWTDNKDFHESTRRVVILDSPGQRRARAVRDATIEREEFKEIGIAKYEISPEDKSERTKYRRRKI